ncbi:MAG: HAMP domain-containing sensor histidine kinase [Sporolactobacillus sp.]
MKMRVRTRRIGKRTTLVQMTFWYIFIMFITVSFIGCAVLSTVTYQLLKETEHEVLYVEKQLTKTAKHKHPHWNEAIETMLYIRHPDFYVHIRTPEKRTIYSRGSEGVTDNTSYPISLSLFSSISFKSKLIPVYHHRTTSHGYTFDIYVRMISIHHFLMLMMKVLIICTLIGIVIGSLAIYQLSRRLSRPLRDVTRWINQIIETHNLNQPIAVPLQPEEVHDLALSFNQMMRQLNQQMEREQSFVSDASHELRTPLSAIRGHIGVIRRHGAGHPEVVEQSMHFIDQESKRMQRLIDQLLVIARLQQRKIRTAPLNLSLMIKNVIADYAPIINQTFSAEIQDQIIAEATEDYVHQILVSLLENAHKYTAGDGWIKVLLTCDSKYAYINVQNSGAHIPDEEKEKIFERFYRLDKSRSSSEGGSGLGLAIIKQLVEIDGGKIGVKDLEPTGSQFIVRFKLAKETSLKKIKA